MAKSKRGKGNRRTGGHPAKRAPAPSGRSAELEAKRLVESVAAEAQRRAAEALSPDTPPERVAELVVLEFEDLPAPPGLARQLERDGSAERAHAVAAEVARLAPGSITALTLAAEVAGQLDADPVKGDELLEQALDADMDPDGTVSLAWHMLQGRRDIDALQLVREELAEEPEDEDANELYGIALERLHRRAAAGERLEAVERAELARFDDREGIYALRDAMRVLIEERRPDLSLAVVASLRDWMEEFREARGDAGEDPFGLSSEEELGQDSEDESGEALFRFAMEHAWLMGPEDGAPAGAPPRGVEAELSDLDAPLAQLMTDTEADAEMASSARDWFETVTYGLWQVQDPVPAPGLWLTDILTGARRYAAIPPEQLPGMSRWSVLTGALVALDGIWRSTGAVVLLRPSEADGAADWVHQGSAAIAKALRGKRARRPSRRREPQPHGVLADVDEPMEPSVAVITGQVLGTLLPGIIGEVWRRRAAGPKLTNTEGHRLRMITAQVTVNDPPGLTDTLAAHADFRTEEGGELSWWGRELSATERATALAQIRALAGEDEPIEEDDDGPQRWLRGRLEPRAGGFEVSVNSDERLEALLQLLRELGAQPEVARRSVIDPAQDMPPIRLGAPLPFGASQSAIDAWQALWPEEKVPALGGATPRAAARREQSRPVLEAVLREFEHDAYPLARAGRPAPDMEQLRREIGMEVWWESPGQAHQRA